MKKSVGLKSIADILNTRIRWFRTDTHQQGIELVGISIFGVGPARAEGSSRRAAAEDLARKLRGGQAVMENVKDTPMVPMPAEINPRQYK